MPTHYSDALVQDMQEGDGGEKQWYAPNAGDDDDDYEEREEEGEEDDEDDDDEDFSASEDEARGGARRTTARGARRPPAPTQPQQQKKRKALNISDSDSSEQDSRLTKTTKRLAIHNNDSAKIQEILARAKPQQPKSILKRATKYKEVPSPAKDEKAPTTKRPRTLEAKAIGDVKMKPAERDDANENHRRPTKQRGVCVCVCPALESVEPSWY